MGKWYISWNKIFQRRQHIIESKEHWLSHICQTKSFIFKKLMNKSFAFMRNSSAWFESKIKKIKIPNNNHSSFLKSSVDIIGKIRCNGKEIPNPFSPFLLYTAECFYYIVRNMLLFSENSGWPRILKIFLALPAEQWVLKASFPAVKVPSFRACFRDLLIKVCKRIRWFDDHSAASCAALASVSFHSISSPIKLAGSQKSEASSSVAMPRMCVYSSGSF